METDSFFCQLFKYRPETLFELLGEPAVRAKSYRFDSVELKKSFRIDGLYLPRSPNLPLCFVEVQFQRIEKFYANLFAKVFCYLEENRPDQEWNAVAIFASRRIEPKCLSPYQNLLASKRVHRVYLDEIEFSDNPSIGMSLLRLLQADKAAVSPLVRALVAKVRSEIPDADRQENVIQLMESVVMRLIPEKSYQEVRDMVLHDIRKSKAWQELYQEAREETREETREEMRQEISKRLHGQGRTLKEIAEALDVSMAQVRKWISKG
jgi:predicted transposase/invertase (TIGR01784 family)